MLIENSKWNTEDEKEKIQKKNTNEKVYPMCIEAHKMWSLVKVWQ